MLKMLKMYAFGLFFTALKNFKGFLKFFFSEKDGFLKVFKIIFGSFFYIYDRRQAIFHAWYGGATVCPTHGKGCDSVPHAWFGVRQCTPRLVRGCDNVPLLLVRGATVCPTLVRGCDSVPPRLVRGCDSVPNACFEG